MPASRLLAAPAGDRLPFGGGPKTVWGEGDSPRFLRGLRKGDSPRRFSHDALVRAWWDDTGFAGRCPSCGRWIHFTIRGKRAIDESATATLPQLPANWASEAVIL
ncbi:MAG TPA: hypothetical protein VGY55_06420 [Pirellulales bacterium]|nr:hypothetical protein [Pirellulales bacterium]